MLKNRRRPAHRRALPPRIEQLEKRQLLAGDLGHNFIEAEDVNLDGHVSAIDALLVINQLSRQRENSGASESAGDVVALKDVNDNGDISALDALQIINKISRGNRSRADLELGIEQLAAAILTENLPPGMRPQTAERWLANLEERVDAPPARRGSFNRLDANEDGVLTESEVNRHTWNRISRSDRDEDGEVALHELQASREENEVQVQGPSPEESFVKLDLNGDGSLTEDELSDHVWNRLATADADGNAAVRLAEVLADHAKHETGVQMPRPEASFEMLGPNQDGQLTEDEVSPALSSKLSTDDEDAIARVIVEELDSGRRQREGRIQDTDPEEQFFRLDVNEGGQITSDEVSRRTWRRIKSSDANGDGGVTLEELIEASAKRGMYVANALVHHLVPDQANGKSVIMVPGHNLSSAIYLTTPDGRDGWAQQLAAEGYQVYVINDPNLDFSRGFHVEGFTDVPTEGAPPPDPDATQSWSQDIWRRWGFGSSEGNPYPDTRFPTDDFDEFEADYPYVSGARRSFTDSIVALMDIVGPASLVAHSAGGPKVVGAALQRPELVESLVLVEPTSPPTTEDFPALAGISMLGIYGDNIESRNQTGRKEATEIAAELFADNGGVGEVISLPRDLEIYGNTHLMMQDNNSEFILASMIDWLDSNTP